MSGIFGTRAELLSDLNLIFQIIILVTFLLGVRFAKEKKFNKHETLMRAALILNGISILFVMLPFFRVNIYTFLDELSVLGFPLTFIHAFLGGLAEILGIVLILKKFGNFRVWMRLTFALWVIALILGMLFYFRYYVF